MTSTLLTSIDEPPNLPKGSTLGLACRALAATSLGLELPHSGLRLSAQAGFVHPN